MQPTARSCETNPALCDGLSAGLRNRAGSFSAAKRGSFVSCVCSSVGWCGVRFADVAKRRGGGTNAVKLVVATREIVRWWYRLGPDYLITILCPPSNVAER